MKFTLFFLVMFLFGFVSCAPIKVLSNHGQSEVAPPAVKPMSVETSTAMAKEPSLEPEGCVKVEVDYDRSPFDMDVSWFPSYSMDGSSDVKPNGRAKAKKEICWFKFDFEASSDEAQRGIEDSGDFMVADLWEINALSTTMPDLQRQFPIVGLGTVEQRTTGVYVPVFDETRQGRGSGISRRSSQLIKWFGYCRFAAVRM